MATPAAITAANTLNLDKCISAARRMNPQPAKNTSFPFSSINLTRPATEQNLPLPSPSTSPSQHHPLSSVPFVKILHHHTVAEQTRWRGKKTGRVEGKDTQGPWVRVYMDFVKWMSVTSRRWKGKRRLKTRETMKNGLWTEPLLTLLHAGDRWAGECASWLVEHY